MYDRIESELAKSLELARQLDSIIQSLSKEPELTKTFFAPVFDIIVTGSAFAVKNLKIVILRYSQRKAAKELKP